MYVVMHSIRNTFFATFGNRLARTFKYFLLSVLAGYIQPDAAMTSFSETAEHRHVVGISLTSDCDYEFNSSMTSRGSLWSPFYPNWYPAFITCRYTFLTRSPQETVRLQFTDFDLHYPNGDPNRPNDCSDVATLTVTEFNEDHHNSDIAIYCGSRLPPALMSAPGQHLVLTFNSRDTSMTRGFAANYSFHTDFSVNGGVQDTNSEGCQFLFRKDVVGVRGTFTSPNYPGIYPRNTVCHYMFYGDPDDRILIVFPYFDVEGIPTECNSKTLSDYVELSNFNINLTDRKMARLCSVRLERSIDFLYSFESENFATTESATPRSVRSDGNFFRVTFQSNDIYSATGFVAVYSFEQHREPLYSPLSGVDSSISNSSRVLLLFLLLVCFTGFVSASSSSNFKVA